jgi:hypothetical protein
VTALDTAAAVDSDQQAYRSTILSIVPDAAPEEVAAVLAVLATLPGGSAGAEAVPQRRSWARSLQPDTVHTAEPFGWVSAVHQYRT